MWHDAVIEVLQAKSVMLMACRAVYGVSLLKWRCFVAPIVNAGDTIK